MRKISAGKDILELRMLLKNLVLYAESHVRQENEKEEPSECISGTYEEIYKEVGVTVKRFSNIDEYVDHICGRKFWR